MTAVLVFAEQRNGVLNPQSFEAVVGAQKLAAGLGHDLDIGLVGDNPQSPTRELCNVSARALHVVSDASLEPYRAGTQKLATRALIEKLSPSYVLFPHTYIVRDFAPRLAAGYSRLLISDCVDLRCEGAEVIFVRQLFQGKLNADCTVNGAAPHFASFQAGAFRADELKQTDEPLPVEKLDFSLDASRFRVRADLPVQEASGGVDISKADVIVSVGRGLQSEDNLATARELATALNAELGASRPVVDAGWMPKHHQIGSSGKTVAPKLYVALGISGASQHMVGVKGARTIVAINSDECAPVFAYADYGIVGDVLEVVPALTKALRE